LRQSAPFLSIKVPTPLTLVTPFLKVPAIGVNR